MDKLLYIKKIPHDKMGASQSEPKKKKSYGKRPDPSNNTAETRKIKYDRAGKYGYDDKDDQYWSDDEGDIMENIKQHPIETLIATLIALAILAVFIWFSIYMFTGIDRLNIIKPTKSLPYDDKDEMTPGYINLKPEVVMTSSASVLNK